MKTPYTLAAILAASGITAPVQADSFTEAVVRDLINNGFRQIEIERGDDAVLASGIGEASWIEVIYDRETGQILEQERGYLEDDDMDRGDDEIEIVMRDGFEFDDEEEEDDWDEDEEDDDDEDHDEDDEDEDDGEDEDDEDG